MTSQPRLLPVSLLVFASGFCALVYQTTWLREFRLIFGASTAATAAVLAIFMGGIGVGSILLGRRSESEENPLKFYAKLEILIALTAGATPLLLWIVRSTYLAMGGTLAMGSFLGTLVRLFLSALAIGAPTILMGGTLPALARAVTAAQDANRRSVAGLYGINTLGAVTGTVATTFYLFEAWGNRMTLGGAATLNAVIALVAFAVARSLKPAKKGEKKPSVATVGRPDQSPPIFILAAAAVTGLVFLLMEMVWYRMLSPLLGGSTFTFGLILAFALLGIGLGGIIYAFRLSNRRVTINSFAFLCALEGLFIAVPFALGDRLALLTMFLFPLGTLGFFGHVVGWSVICAIVVLPAAILSGIQFPTLLALRGQGRTCVGADTGIVYAANTIGAIAGALAGGFGILPALSAPGVWKLAVILLCALAVTAAAAGFSQSKAKVWRQLPATLAAGAALFLLTATGPTAFWRHSQIGVGRVQTLQGSKNDYHDLENVIRRDILWEQDGVESSVALLHLHGLSFLVNGRCDGHSQGDKGTQMMMGMVPAFLQDNPTSALVIGLGTGSSAGWLGAIPSMQRVDVAELEPAILKVAEACAPVNQHVLNNPKVHVIVGDGREVMLSTRQKYDVIASEPSNPYRAGIASLFTKEFYGAAASRLKPGGLFAQWVQAYEIDGTTLQTIYATMKSVFAQVDTWQTQQGDLLFVGSVDRRQYDPTALRNRLGQEPFKSAAAYAWGVTDLEGFLAHFIADDSFAEAMARVDHPPLNTDDHTILEFAFARHMDPQNKVRSSALRLAAQGKQADRLALAGDADGVNWSEVANRKVSMLLGFDELVDIELFSGENRSRVEAYNRYLREDFAAALASWQEQAREPNNLRELSLVAECMADAGKPESTSYIDKLRPFAPIEANIALAQLFCRRGQLDQATNVLVDVFERLRTDPWADREITARALVVARRISENSESAVNTERLYQALSKRFSVFSAEESRQIALLELGSKLDGGSYGERSLAAVEAAEPYVPWQENFLKVRKLCYEHTGSPRLAQAEKELTEFRRDQPALFDPAAMLPKAGFAEEVPQAAKSRP